MSIQNLDLDGTALDQAVLIPRILVVEPDPALGEMLCELFADVGYDCKLLQECSNIIPVLESFSPDVVLIEYLLADIKGGELCTQVKSDMRFKDIPVILYSAFPQLLWSVEEYRCDEFLPKPFDIDKLLLILERLIVKGRERRRFSQLEGTLKNRLSYLSKFLGR